MSKEAQGWLVATNGGTRNPMVGFWVYLKGPWLRGERDGVFTDAQGQFSIRGYFKDGSEINHHRTIEVGVKDSVGRDIRVVSGGEVTDVPNDDILFLHDVVIDIEDATGLWVTLNTGQAERIGEGNRVTILTDQDAFAYAAAMIAAAKGQILITQLEFALPELFTADATRETPQLIFDFHPPTSDPNRSPGFDIDHPRAAGVGDSRPERMLLAAAELGVGVRILLHEFTIPLFLKIIAGVLLFPFVGTYAISIIQDLVSKLTDADEATRYFGAAGASKIRVQPFKQSVFGAGVMHAKLVAVDGRVLSIGSPFEQGYVDDHGHPIDSWIRGDSDGYPRHDAGFAMTGPAAVQLYRTMKLLWDTATPDDILPDLQNLNDPPPDRPPGPPQPPSIIDRPEDGVCDVQIVRTLSTDKFANMDEGEKGILEAYQRGIANANDFIYLENQYFTNDKIAEALYKRLLLQPMLQVIVVLNIEPDTPTYPFKQRRLITRIRRELRRNNKNVEPSARFGVFTRWRHETGTPRPRLLPVYIHAKAAVIDNTWATVGSANLDGLSLDSSLPSDIVRGIANAFGAHSTREQRAIEVNGLMIDSETSGVADVLRRKLWAEHLGYVDAHGAPDINAADLRRESRPPGPAAPDPNQPPKTPQGGWLKLWHDRAAATLQNLTNNPSQPTTGMATVLPWPEDDTTHKTPRDYLTTLGIHSYAVVPLKGTRKFDFKAGDWQPGSKAPMDYD